MLATALRLMNLNTAAMICDRVLPAFSDNRLIDRLTVVIDAGQGEDFDSTRAAAHDALKFYDASAFADSDIQIFPEFNLLGLRQVSNSRLRGSLTTLAKEEFSQDEVEKALVEISIETCRLKELAKEIKKLALVTQFYGVERRETFDADALAVFQIADEAGWQEYSIAALNGFIEQMQSFQEIVAFCEGGAENKDANIRMIAGKSPLIVADISLSAAMRLQQIIREVRRRLAAMVEIGDAQKRLAAVGVSDQIARLLKDEEVRIRRFDDGESDMFFTDLRSTENASSLKLIAISLLSLMREGVRVDGVLLKRNGLERPPAGAASAQDVKQSEADRA